MVAALLFIMPMKTSMSVTKLKNREMSLDVDFFLSMFTSSRLAVQIEGVYHFSYAGPGVHGATGSLILITVCFRSVMLSSHWVFSELLCPWRD